jgi:type VI secretion system Hcp family effector
MKKTFTFLLIFILACNIRSVAQLPNIFMQINDPTQINGESLSSTHTNWVDIKAIQGGASAPVSITSGGVSTGRAQTGEFTFLLCVDKATAHLKTQMYTGSVIPSVVVDFERVDGSATLVTYYKVELVNAYVTSVSEAGNDADGKPLVSISLNSVKFKYTYRPLTANGSFGTPVVFGWDNVLNAAW